MGLPWRDHRLGRDGQSPRGVDQADAWGQGPLEDPAQLQHPRGHQGQIRASGHLRAPGKPPAGQAGQDHPPEYGRIFRKFRRVAVLAKTLAERTLSQGLISRRVNPKHISIYSQDPY